MKGSKFPRKIMFVYTKEGTGKMKGSEFQKMRDERKYSLGEVFTLNADLNYVDKEGRFVFKAGSPEVGYFTRVFTFNPKKVILRHLDLVTLRCGRQCTVIMENDGKDRIVGTVADQSFCEELKDYDGNLLYRSSGILIIRCPVFDIMTISDKNGVVKWQRYQTENNVSPEELIKTYKEEYGCCRKKVTFKSVIG